MRKIVIAFSCLLFSSGLFADESLQQLKEELRKEMLAEIDQKLEEVRQELVARVDEKLAGVKQQAYLGVSLKEISAGLRTLLDLESNQGVLVISVDANSPAEKAGIEKMDIILEWNNHSVSSKEQLEDLVSSSKPGQEVQVLILQKREKKNILVKVGGKLGKKESSNPLRELFGNSKRKDLNKLLEKQMEDLFGELPEEEKEMLQSMQKNLQQQLEKLQKDPESLHKMGKNLEELFKEVLPNRKNNKREEQPKEESIDDLLDDIMGDSNSYLGMFFIPIPEPLKQKENYTYNYGVLISESEEGSVSHRAGIKKWEILMKINGEKINSPKQAKEIISKLSKQKLILEIFSNGESRTVTLTE